MNYNLSDTDLDLAALKETMRNQITGNQRVRINNILVSEDWAAIHFWAVTTDEQGNKTADDHMHFLHFVEQDGQVRVDMAWVK